MYGNRLTRDFGDSAPSIWANSIRSLRDYELARGLRNLLNTGSGSPPTLPQFMKACRQAETDGPERNHSPQTSLPKSEFGEAIWAHAQKCLLAYLMKRPVKTTEAELEVFIAEKNKLVTIYREVLTDDDTLTGSEIRDGLFKAWNLSLNKINKAKAA